MKIRKMLILSMTCLASSTLMYVSHVYADTNANINVGESVGMVSNGNQGTESSGHGNKNTTSSKVILHGKNTNSIADNEYYEVSSEINTDGDFAITFFKTYEKMKKWFDNWQGEGFYNYLVELYEKQFL